MTVFSGLRPELFAERTTKLNELMREGVWRLANGRWLNGRQRLFAVREGPRP